MKRILIPALVLVVSAASLAGPQAPPPVPSRGQRAGMDLRRSLREAKLLLVAVKDREVRRKLTALLTQAEASALVLERAALAAESANRLTDKEFKALVASVKKQSFSSDRSKYLVDFAKLNRVRGKRLSCKQVSALLETVDFDNDRVPAAVALYTITHDRASYLSALDVFDFESNRKKVVKELKLR